MKNLKIKGYALKRTGDLETAVKIFIGDTSAMKKEEVDLMINAVTPIFKENILKLDGIENVKSKFNFSGRNLFDEYFEPVHEEFVDEKWKKIYNEYTFNNKFADSFLSYLSVNYELPEKKKND